MPAPTVKQEAGGVAVMASRLGAGPIFRRLAGLIRLPPGHFLSLRHVC